MRVNTRSIRQHLSIKESQVWRGMSDGLPGVNGKNIFIRKNQK